MVSDSSKGFIKAHKIIIMKIIIIIIILEIIQI